jgi:hypothetical protein
VTLILGCGHRWWAVNGITYPTWNNFDWTRLNDGNELVHSISMNVPDAYMELDFGEERPTNRIRVVHHSASRSNGTTLYLLNGNREVLYTKVFDVIGSLVFDVYII